jgi:hypothetical protein
LSFKDAHGRLFHTLPFADHSPFTHIHVLDTHSAVYTAHTSSRHRSDDNNPISMDDKSFPALPHFYKLLFLYFEPGELRVCSPSPASPLKRNIASVFLPAILTWGYPGAAWFFHDLGVPPLGAPIAPIDHRTEMVIWQLGSCAYLT